jgi:hypothetical protein
MQLWKQNEISFTRNVVTRSLNSLLILLNTLTWNVLQLLYGSNRQGKTRKETWTRQKHSLTKRFIIFNLNVGSLSNLVRRFYKPSFVEVSVVLTSQGLNDFHIKPWKYYFLF